MATIIAIRYCRPGLVADRCRLQVETANGAAEDEGKVGERAPLLHTHSLRSMAKADSIVSVPSLHSKMRCLKPGEHGCTMY